VLAESFERIHRSNLVGMGILPLQFLDDENAETCGLTGEESYDIVGLTHVLDNFAPGKTVKVKAKKADDTVVDLDATVRIDTPQEVLYYKHGGILQYVLRQLLQGKTGAAKA
jgi:aconitate hydratase